MGDPLADEAGITAMATIVACLVVAMLLCAVDCRTCLQRHRGGRSTLLPIVQLVASSLNVINQSVLLVEGGTIFSTYKACHTVDDFGTSIYVIMQLCTGSVIILRTSSFVNRYRCQSVIKGIMFLVLVLSCTLSVLSTRWRPFNPEEVYPRLCRPSFDRMLQTTSKSLLGFLYLALLVLYLRPSYELVRSQQQRRRQRAEGYKQLRTVLTGISARIAAAIIVLLSSSLAGTLVRLSVSPEAHAFSLDSFFIEFSVQNLASILASTFSLTHFPTRNKSKHSSGNNTDSDQNTQPSDKPDNNNLVLPPNGVHHHHFHHHHHHLHQGFARLPSPDDASTPTVMISHPSDAGNYNRYLDMTSLTTDTTPTLLLPTITTTVMLSAIDEEASIS
ncbi:hypothetical protein RI367_000233 [Sorochytrium milnesiophthora]